MYYLPYTIDWHETHPLASAALPSLGVYIRKPLGPAI
jgi:hypothetical protein